MGSVRGVLNGCDTKAISLVRVEPVVELEPTTYRLQDAKSTSITAFSSDFRRYCRFRG